jgi:hypothetical protein
LCTRELRAARSGSDPHIVRSLGFGVPFWQELGGTSGLAIDTAVPWRQSGALHGR